MPNYVKNEITFKGEKETVKKFLSQFKSKDNPFDFDKIIPIIKI